MVTATLTCFLNHDLTMMPAAAAACCHNASLSCVYAYTMCVATGILRHHTYRRAQSDMLWVNPFSTRSSNSNSTTFELRTFSTNSKFDECFKRFVVECKFVESPCSTTDFICTESKRVQTNMFFSQIQPITQNTVECAT